MTHNFQLFTKVAQKLLILENGWFMANKPYNHAYNNSYSRNVMLHQSNMLPKATDLGIYLGLFINSGIIVKPTIYRNKLDKY